MDWNYWKWISNSCKLLSDGVIKVNNNIKVTIKFHTITGVILIQGSNIKIWGEREFTRLQQFVEDNMGIQLLLKEKGWTLVNSPADGHCLLHSVGRGMEEGEGGKKTIQHFTILLPRLRSTWGCSFYTLNEVNNEQHSPLSVILKQRSAISFNLYDSDLHD